MSWVTSIRVLLVACCLGLVSILSSCKDDKSTSGICNSEVPQLEVQANFSTLAMLSLDSAISATLALESEVISFANTSSSARDYGKLATKLKSAQYFWVLAEPFQYGPAGDLTAGFAVNPFPVDEDQVDLYLAGQPFASDSAPAFDRGFPALDYILQGLLKDDQQFFDDATRLDFTLTLLTDIKEKQTALRASWENDETFATVTGTAAGTPFSTMINAISKHFEDSRRDRLGIPFGVSTLGFANPQTVEAPYGDFSTSLLLASSTASARAYSAVQGIGVDDYLRSLGNPEGASLGLDIKNQYLLISDAANQIQAPLKEAVVNETDAVQSLYNAMSRQVVFLKTDLPAVTCVAITYVDNPSDSD